MVPEWSDTPLTQCPNNPAHSVVLESESIFEVARLTSHLGNEFSTTSTSFVDVGNFIYQGTDYYSNDRVDPKYLKIRASIVAGTYDLQLLDSSSNQLWGVTGATGSSEKIITIDFDTITNKPANESILILKAKTTGSSLKITSVGLFNAILPE